MTFYVTYLDDPWNSIGTLPGFTIEEAADCVEHDSSFRGCIPMTADERRRFLAKCDEAGEGQYRDVYEKMKDTFMYQQFLDGTIESKLSYSFWITSAYDTYTTVFAIGADTVGDYEFNLTRIAKRLGEKNFYNFVAGKGKRVKDFSTLVKMLNELGIRDVKYTKEDLIQACNEDRYFVLRK